MAGSDGRQRVNLDALKSFLTLKPEQKILTKFDNFVRPIFIQIQSLNSANKKLKEARDALLPRLMSGAIDV